MNKRTVSFLVGTALASTLTLGAAGLVFAQDNDGALPPPNEGSRPPLRGQVRDIQQLKRTDVAGMRASTTAQIKGIRTDARGAIKNEREDMKAAMMNATTTDARMGLRDKRDQMHEDIQDIRRAAVASTTDLRQKMRLEIEDRRDEAKDDIMEAVRERNMRLASSTEKMMRMGSTSPRMNTGTSTDAEKAKRAAKAVEQAAKFAAQAVDRMGAAIDRMNTIVARLQSRIDKVTAAGGNTTAAKAALADAQTKITAAKDGITTVSATFAEVATLSNPKDGASKVETAMKNEQALMKAAQDALMKVVGTLIGQKGADTPATPVTTGTTTSSI
jgi:hypothetical protein